jgi:hypothetical protein
LTPLASVESIAAIVPMVAARAGRGENTMEVRLQIGKAEISAASTSGTRHVSAGNLHGAGRGREEMRSEEREARREKRLSLSSRYQLLASRLCASHKFALTKMLQCTYKHQNKPEPAARRAGRCEGPP